MKKHPELYAIGIGLVGFSLLAKMLGAPLFLQGLLTGMGLGILIVGLLPKRIIEAIKSKKRALFRFTPDL